jgi:hypothetical protein
VKKNAKTFESVDWGVDPRLDAEAMRIGTLIAMAAFCIMNAQGEAGKSERYAIAAEEMREVADKTLVDCDVSWRWKVEGAASLVRKAYISAAEAALFTRKALELIGQVPVECRAELFASSDACVRDFAIRHLAT